MPKGDDEDDDGAFQGPTKKDAQSPRRTSLSRKAKEVLLAKEQESDKSDSSNEEDSAAEIVEKGTKRKAPQKKSAPKNTKKRRTEDVKKTKGKQQKSSKGKESSDEKEEEEEEAESEEAEQEQPKKRKAAKKPAAKPKQAASKVTKHNHTHSAYFWQFPQKTKQKTTKASSEPAVRALKFACANALLTHTCVVSLSEETNCSAPQERSLEDLQQLGQ